MGEGKHLLTAENERLVDRITDVYIESVDRYLGQVGDLIDVFTFWYDVATQDGWMINPETYVEVIKPRQKRRRSTSPPSSFPSTSS